MTRKQNVKVLIWDPEELLLVEPGGLGGVGPEGAGAEQASALC